jgi:hypothetical protein
MAECSICLENSSDLRYELISCPSCDVETCMDCAKEYILSSSQEAHCSNCKVVWSTRFLLETFMKSWVEGVKKGQYRYHRKNVLLNREKALIPEAMTYIAANKDKVDVQRKLDECNQEIRELNSALRKLYKTRRDLKIQLNEGTSTSSNFNLICPCPKESCRGMIDSETARCCICNRKVCIKCRELRKKGHKCDKEKVKTVKLLKKDTKACPKCGVNIYKIEGCPQMFCTNCHFSFDWETGKEEKGVIHNPHAVQWYRTHNRDMPNIHDIPCGGLIDWHYFDTIMYESREIIDYICCNTDDLDYLTKITHIGDEYNRSTQNLEKIYRSVAHVQYALNRHREKNDFDKYRMEYVMGNITEDRWKQKIFLLERANSRNRLCTEVYTTYRHLGIERFRDLYEKLQKCRDQHENYPKKYTEERTVKRYTRAIKKTVKEMNAIIEYFDNVLLTELPPLGCKVANSLLLEKLS